MPAQGDAVGDMPERGLVLVALVLHPRRTHITDASDRKGRHAVRSTDLKELIVGTEGSIQATLSQLNLAEEVAASCGQGAFTG